MSYAGEVYREGRPESVESGRYDSWVWLFVALAGVAFLLAVILLVLAGTGNTEAISLIRRLGDNVEKIWQGVLTAGSQVSTQGARTATSKVTLLQNGVMFIVLALGLVQPLFSKNRNGLMGLCAAIMILAGSWFPQPWRSLAIFLGPLLLIFELRTWGGTWWIQGAVVAIISAVATLIAYLPALGAVRGGLENIEAVADLINTLGYVFMLMVFMIIAMLKLIEGTKTYSILALLMYLWKVSGKHPWMGWSAPRPIAPEQLLTSFDLDFFITGLFALHAVAVLALIAFDIIEAPWFGRDQLVMVIAYGFVGWGIHALGASGVLGGDWAGWLGYLLKVLPPWAIFAIGIAFYSRSIPKPQISVITRQLGVVRLAGDTMPYIPLPFGMWLPHVVLLPYFIVPFVVSLLVDANTAVLILSLIFG